MPQSSHNTDLYTIGKGILYIKEFGASDNDYADMGNAPNAEIEPIIERLPHYSSRSGYRTKDKNPTISTEYNLNITLDEISQANLAKFLMGSLSTDLITISALQMADQEYSIKFIEDNPIGLNKIWFFHRLTISPNGAMSLITEEWEQISITCEGLSDVSNNPTSPYFTVTAVTTTTTTTSTSTTTTTTTTTA